VTNVRFTQDKKRIISIGGADHAIFQWRFIPDTVAEADIDKLSELEAKNVSHQEELDLPHEYQAYMDSNSEDSDSEASGKEVDSDIENEKEISYDRVIYKEDLKVGPISIDTF
jgi:hypothetical protein